MARDSMSLSGHSKSSHHGRGAFMSITVRKDDPSEKAGIRLEQESNGRLRVSNIARNGLFHDSELEIGDIVLSINAIRLSSGEGPEVLVEVANKARSTITMVVKKPSKESLEENTAANKKKLLKKKKEADTNVMDNNRTTTDNYYQGIAKHNEDGSLNIKYTQEDINQKRQQQRIAKTVQTTTITGTKTMPRQDVGIKFAVQNKKLFVVAMDEDDSIFASTALQVGDRVLSINDMNFRTHADDEYATKICMKAKETITLIVEKNDPTFVAPKPIVKKKNSAAAIQSSKGKSKYNEDDDTVSIPSTYSEDGDTDSIEDMTRFGVLPNPKQTEFKIEKYTQTIITVPKKFTKQQVGLEFRLDDRVGLVYIYKILEKSLFLDTNLEEGDWILSINNVNLRGNGPKGKPTPNRPNQAAMACMKAKESVSMVVLKDDSTFFERKFNLDQSSSNLDWMVASTRGLNVN